MYQDSLTHEQFGKSRLPMFIVKGHITHNIPLHHHNFAELSLVVEGSGTEIINGKPHPFRKGSVSFLLPHHIHEVQLNSPTAIKYNCMFDLNLLFLSPSDRDLANALLKTGLQYPSHYDLDEDQASHMCRL
ncbi:MAG: AraC family transcriptional regulator, partial [Paenibacillus sp.]|nr:AraC family transcriptional regulator [Paenibacillus sp.]